MSASKKSRECTDCASLVVGFTYNVVYEPDSYNGGLIRWTPKVNSGLRCDACAVSRTLSRIRRGPSARLSLSEEQHWYCIVLYLCCLLGYVSKSLCTPALCDFADHLTPSQSTVCGNLVPDDESVVQVRREALEKVVEVLVDFGRLETHGLDAAEVLFEAAIEIDSAPTDASRVVFYAQNEVSTIDSAITAMQEIIDAAAEEDQTLLE